MNHRSATNEFKRKRDVDAAMTTAAPLPRIGLAVTTIGRPALAGLLVSAANSSHPPSVVAVANQSGHDLHLDRLSLPFPVLLVESTGGASKGRNEATACIADKVEVLGFPNDDSKFPTECLLQVAGAFDSLEPPAAVACALVEQGKPRYKLPVAGPMNKLTIWRAIEPATFTTVEAFNAADGFREDLGTGCGTPWQSGEGTDLLLRFLQSGQAVICRPEITVIGTGERRDLPIREFVAKQRRYARGTGYLYRVHKYPLHRRLRIVLSPWYGVFVHDLGLVHSARIAYARSLGRMEGLLARRLPRTKV